MSLPLNFNPDEKLQILRFAHSVQDVASALEMRPDGIFHLLKNSDNGSYYQSFEIDKKNGGKRPINRAVRGMALAQERLSAIFKATHSPKPFVHGYVKGKSFLSNAQYHEKQRWVLNVDVEDFFGSITFPRVRGLFMSNYFGFNHRVATILARLTTFQNSLPQGARTSPILSNIIANNLDRKLISIARENRIKYTRYADDITFSSDQRSIPKSLVKSWQPEYGDREIELGEELKNAFESQGFAINSRKTRLQLYGERQMVTGLIVNQKANVFRRDIAKLRMQIYSARKFGPEHAAKLWLDKKDSADQFWSFLWGWLAHIRQVRGSDDPVLAKLCKQSVEINSKAPKWIIRSAELVKEFDVFLSHASEDKPKVRLLKNRLEKIGLTVFFDEDSIQWGDSIVEKINFGLLRSNLFVPILTENFSNKGWTNKELNSAISLNINRKSRILPICVEGFHVGKNYPLLNDTLYKTWPTDSKTENAWIDEISDQLLAKIEKDKQASD